MFWLLSTLVIAAPNPADPNLFLSESAERENQMTLKKKLIDFHSERLPNGLDVLLLPLEGTDLVAVQTWMRVGSQHETQPGMTGYAHFFEHLMFHGSKKLSRQARKAELLKIGAEENAWTSQDFTCYHILAPSAGLEKILEIEADRFKDLHLVEEMLRREAGAVLGEFRKGRNNPGTLVWETLSATAFQVHGYKHSTIGLEADVRAMPSGLEKARLFYRDHYRPENAVLVIAGKVDPVKTMEMIRKTHASWKRTEKVQSSPPAPEPQQLEPRSADVSWTKGPTAARLQLAYKIPSVDMKTRAGLAVISELLNARSAPLKRELTEGSDAVAHSFWAQGGRGTAPGLFSLGVKLKSPSGMDAAESKIKAGLKNLSEIDPDRLLKIKRSIRKRALLGLQSPDRWAFGYGYSFAAYGRSGAFDEYLGVVDSLEPADISELAEKIFRTSGLTRVRLTTPETESVK